MPRQLVLALAFSLLLHALPFATVQPPRPERQAQRPLLDAHLRFSPPPPILEQPPLRLPEPARREPKHRPAPTERQPGPSPSPSPAGSWNDEIKRQLKELDKRGKFYPEEAIVQGLEGEAMVLLLLDGTGNAVAARIEESSGHRLLDDAALQAARALKSLPAATPRETRIPVRFRLR